MEKAREIAIEICELFEEVLDRHGIDIPSEDRDAEIEDISEEDIEEAGLSHLYGEEYYALEDAVTEIVERIMKEKQMDDVEVER